MTADSQSFNFVFGSSHVERYTERARQVIVLAQEEARSLKHNYVGTEHLLLGVAREEEGVGARVLASLRVDTGRLRDRVADLTTVAETSEDYAQLPFTPRAKKVCEIALREALSLGHNYIGTEHLLLALVRDTEGVAGRLLDDFDADADRVRNEVVRMIGGRSYESELSPAGNGWKPEIRNLGGGLMLATCPKCRGNRTLPVAGAMYDCDRCGAVGEVQVR